MAREFDSSASYQDIVRRCLKSLKLIGSSVLKNNIETLKVKNRTYKRFTFQSKILNQSVHCGFFRPDLEENIIKTVYLLHGGNADDSQPVQAGLLPVLDDILSRGIHKNTQFVFPYVSTSFLHDHPTMPSKSFSNYFLNELIAASEAGTKTRAENRALCGWSLGGQAALNMFMRFPELFGGVGVHFPTLIAFDYTDKKQQDAYALRQHVSDVMLNILVSEFQKEFIDLNDFFNHDPLTLAKNSASTQWLGKKIYFDVGDQDEFGLSEGAKELHEILQKKNVAHQFELVSGGKHDAPLIHAQIAKMLNYLL